MTDEFIKVRLPFLLFVEFLRLLLVKLYLLLETDIKASLLDLIQDRIWEKFVE